MKLAPTKLGLRTQHGAQPQAYRTGVRGITDPQELRRLALEAFDGFTSAVSVEQDFLGLYDRGGLAGQGPAQGALALELGMRQMVGGERLGANSRSEWLQYRYSRAPCTGAHDVGCHGSILSHSFGSVARPMTQAWIEGDHETVACNSPLRT
jgi:hypothetical protein